MSTIVGTMSGEGPHRLVAADDNLLVREGLAGLLGRRDDVDLRAMCASVPELLAAIDREHPDVVLTDIRMPPDHDREGIAVARRLRDTHPDVGVLVLSAHVDPGYALGLLDDGSNGRGYLVKDRLADVDHLTRALTTVANGGTFVDEDVVDALVGRRRGGRSAPMTPLTGRELDVLERLATGRTNDAIARDLCVSRHAIEKHCNSIFAKLGLSEEIDVNRRVAAVLMYLDDASRAA
ncbi:MAG: response regulator transcription factor [Ilumatobacter sp.]|uniref:response regulator transcription factor n=1 Tax=Ilumatobacter sp. TaxID=1967498 RepID=UPI0026195D5B|nr:response regulator transcription factor [Ilumatobacter sp.]MDJ0767254.1 response regulator transcription factor [Ilumatobacter sp.]